MKKNMLKLNISFIIILVSILLVNIVNAKDLNYEDNIIYNSTLLALYGESTYGNVMSTMVSMMVIMLALVSIGCIVVIYNSFAISVRKFSDINLLFLDITSSLLIKPN